MNRLQNKEKKHEKQTAKNEFATLCGWSYILENTS